MSRRSWAIALGLAALSAGCQPGALPVATSPPPTSTPVLTPSPTALPTPAPTATPAIGEPTPTMTASTDPCAGATTDDPIRPPDAYLQPAGAGSAVKGSLGSFTYCGTAADALPPHAEKLVEVPLGDPPTVSLSVLAADALLAYRAGYWPASEWQTDEVRFASADLAAPVSDVEFGGPPAGDWMLAIDLTFASDGGAVFYWHVTVP